MIERADRVVEWKRLFGSDPPFIIAEIGVNYYDIAARDEIEAMEAAKWMVDKAASAGAHAVKFQTYKAGKLAAKSSPAYWNLKEEPTTSQYELFRKYDRFGEEEFRELADHCHSAGIPFLSTPFDFNSADYLDALVPAFKIASSDLTNTPFIEHVAAKGKPILLSTGASTVGEIDVAVRTIRKTSSAPLCLNHCVLSYPTPVEHANLRMIAHLASAFPNETVGYSDHTRADEHMLVLLLAYFYGATILEKHFTLDKNLPGNDHYHAMDPADLGTLLANLHFAESVSGEYLKRPLECELPARKEARRSLVATQDILKGERITREMVTFKRPGRGVPPDQLPLVLGRRARRDIHEDDILTWEDV